MTTQIDVRELVTTAGLVGHEATSKAVYYNGYHCVQLTVDPNHKTAEQGGCDDCTFLDIPSLVFSNGVIEIDVAGQPRSECRAQEEYRRRRE